VSPALSTTAGIGTFVPLQHTGHHDRGAYQLSITVVPDFPALANSSV